MSAMAIASLPAPRPASRGWEPRHALEWSHRASHPDIGLCLYASRLLGSDPSLVLHGGGNSSVKGTWQDPWGAELAALYVKGSGRDMATLEERDLAPVALAAVRGLAEAPALADLDMLRGLKRALLAPEAPAPSVETLVHAVLPHRFVLHAHPDALLALTQTPSGARRARRLFEPELLVVSYVQPGHELARTVLEHWREHGNERMRGLVLLHHGIFTFADDAEEAWHTLLEAVERAQQRLPRPARAVLPEGSPWPRLEIARLRQEISRLAGRAMVVRFDDSPEARTFASHPQVDDLARRGPLTPDHVLRTGRVAAVVHHPSQMQAVLARHAREYRTYFRRHAGRRPLQMLDAAPRLVVAAGAGVFAAGSCARDANIALELYRHTMPAILAAEALGGYRPLTARQVFEMEYWAPEQAKLGAVGAPAPLAGRVALVTGSANGIGRAATAELRAAGAAVVGLDLEASESAEDLLSIRCDVTDPRQLDAALEAAARRFGGLDLLVSGLGAFPAGQGIEDIEDGLWQRVMELNVGSHLALVRQAIPLLKQAWGGGAVVLIGSRNVAAPGPGAAAYSASKAAMTQLGRVAALELAPFGIRVNILHPDGVFDTALWNEQLIVDRARHYGVSAEDYRRRNLLRTEVKARDVGRLAAALCTDLFRCTTGAQIPVDGGNLRVV